MMGFLFAVKFCFEKFRRMSLFSPILTKKGRKIKRKIFRFQSVKQSFRSSRSPPDSTILSELMMTRVKVFFYGQDLFQSVLLQCALTNTPQGWGKLHFVNSGYEFLFKQMINQMNYF